MIRRIAIAAVIAAGLLAPFSAAAPASAGNNVGCNGSDCSIWLRQMIHLNPAPGSGSGNGYTHLAIPQPPCAWVPLGGQLAGSNYIISFFDGTDPGPGSPLGVHQAFLKAKSLLKNPVPGTWWELPVNPKASPAQQQKCWQLPLFVFVPNGQQPPILPIPPLTMAKYAYNHMTIPSPVLETSPAHKGYVNLATYAWGNWAPSPLTHRMGAYKITATLGTLTVTVWAHVLSFTVSPVGPGKAFTDCGLRGSHARPVGQAPATAGAGAAPDCGVLWQAPDASAAVRASVVWDVSWGFGDLNGPTNTKLHRIKLTTQTPPFRVSEIQSVNGN